MSFFSEDRNNLRKFLHENLVMGRSPTPLELREARIRFGHTQREACMMTTRSLRQWTDYESGLVPMPVEQWAEKIRSLGLDRLNRLLQQIHEVERSLLLVDQLLHALQPPFDGRIRVDWDSRQGWKTMLKKPGLFQWHWNKSRRKWIKTRTGRRAENSVRFFRVPEYDRYNSQVRNLVLVAKRLIQERAVLDQSLSSILETEWVVDAHQNRLQEHLSKLEEIAQTLTSPEAPMDEVARQKNQSDGEDPEAYFEDDPSSSL